MTTISLDTRADAPGARADDDTGRLVAQAGAVAAFSRTLLERDGFEHSPARTLELVVAGALTALPAVGGAGLSLVEARRTVAFHAPSDAAVASLEGLQGELGEGPSHDCLRGCAPVVADDLASTDEGRWPRFSIAALEHRVGAVCSVPLPGRDGRTSGTVNLYAPEAGAFDASCVATAELIAAHAALAVHAAGRVAALHEALDSRDTIGQAKGILIERLGLTDQQAFDKLVSSSQETNLKLRDLAAWLVGETVRGWDRPS